MSKETHLVRSIGQARLKTNHLVDLVQVRKGEIGIVRGLCQVQTHPSRSEQRLRSLHPSPMHSPVLVHAQLYHRTHSNLPNTRQSKHLALDLANVTRFIRAVRGWAQAH